jgi:hypothetical protein
VGEEVKASEGLVNPFTGVSNIGTEIWDIVSKLVAEVCTVGVNLPVGSHEVTSRGSEAGGVGILGDQPAAAT